MSPPQMRSFRYWHQYVARAPSLKSCRKNHTLFLTESSLQSKRLKYLSIEDNLDASRYEKVTLATDADGLHIRNLLITYYFRFFDQLLRDGHVLLRTRNAVKELGGKPEITRFEGLGEISPKEFAQFIGKEMRLSIVLILTFV